MTRSDDGGEKEGSAADGEVSTSVMLSGATAASAVETSRRQHAGCHHLRGPTKLHGCADAQTSQLHAGTYTLCHPAGFRGSVPQFGIVLLPSAKLASHRHSATGKLFGRIEERGDWARRSSSFYAPTAPFLLLAAPQGPRAAAVASCERDSPGSPVGAWLASPAAGGNVASGQQPTWRSDAHPPRQPRDKSKGPRGSQSHGVPGYASSGVAIGGCQ